MDTIDTSWNATFWRQYGAAIDMLDNVLVACPDSLWRQPVWRDPSLSSPDVEFWYVAYHALFWLDLYLSGSAEGFAPPAPFSLEELDPAGVLPPRPYTREELRAYLAFARQKCHSALASLTDERARQFVDIPWAKGKSFSYVELQLYTLRHTQEHAAQLSLFLGQHAIHAGPSWVARATSDSERQ
ncbi:MAG TPA: DinB family protein [Ktedonobacterales bacterium]|nr:DinB family protein [Ktedonobacterales bacterium]